MNSKIKIYCLALFLTLISLSAKAQTKYSQFREVKPELFKLESSDSLSKAFSGEIRKAFERIEKSRFDSLEIICDSIGSTYKKLLKTNSLAASHFLAFRAETNRHLGNLDSAVFLYRKSISKLKATNVKARAARYKLLAKTYNNLVQPENTNQIIDSAIAIYKELKDTINLTDSYLIKGEALYRKKDYPKIKKYADLAEILLKKAGINEHPLYLYIWYLRGFIELDNERWASARVQFLKALEITKQYYEKDHWLIAKMRNVCGIGAGETNRTEEELEHHKEALRIRLKVYGKKHYITSITYMNLGNIYNKKGMSDSALYFYKTANTIRRKVLGEKHSKTANSYLKLYLHYINIKTRDLQKALKYAHLAVFSSHPTFNDTADYFSLPVIGDKRYSQRFMKCLEAKARVLKNLGKKHNEKIYYDRILEIVAKIDTVIQNNRKMSVDLNNDRFTLYIRNVLYLAGQRAAHHLFNNFNDVDALSEVIKYNERYKANNLFDAANLHKNRSDKQIEKLFRLKLKRFELKKEFKVTETETEQLNLKSRIIAYSDSIEKLVLQIREKYSGSPIFAHNLKTPSLYEVQNEIAKKTAILQYTVYKNQIFTLYIDKNTPRFIIKPLDNLEENINDLLLLIRNPEIAAEKEMLSLQHKLFKFLFSDEEENEIIGKSIKNLVIIPHNYLWNLPFETCLYKKPNSKTTYQNAAYLLKKYTISYSPSLKNYLNNKKTKSKTDPKILAVAPVFKDVQTNRPTRAISGLLNFRESENKKLRSSLLRDNSISALPYSENEVNDIAELNEKTVLLTNKDANKKKFESLELQSFDIIHIASHAVSNYSDADFSGIILAAADSASDNVLFGGELPVFKLNTDLLVLSACETSIGIIFKGEGVNSLSYKFACIGAKNVIASLWKVPDYETRKLMKTFYEINSKKRKLSYSRKLNKAKLKMINNPRTAHPFYWSAFTINRY